MVPYPNNQVNAIYKAWLYTTRRKGPKEKNIYGSLKLFLCFSQLLGALPQESIFKGKDKMHFKWASWRVAFAFFYIICSLIAVICCAATGVMNGYHISLAAFHVFYGGSLLNLILYLRLSISWSKFVNDWCKVDKIMNANYGYPEKMNLKIWILSGIYLVVVVSDHLLSVANRYYGVKKNYTMAAYYTETFPSLFQIVDVSILGGLYTSLIHAHANLTWAFNDLFIIIMSILLASRFEQISKKLSRECNKKKPILFWRQVREDYNRLSNLCSELDNHISYLVLLSYFENIFFILIQIYHSLEPFNDYLGQVYFIFSFMYLIFKTGSVSYYAAWINDESKVPAYILNNVSTESYNLEIKRLLIQISFDSVALTGCKMFKITRGLLLSVASVIVTYELVLIQFTAFQIVELNNANHHNISEPN